MHTHAPAVRAAGICTGTNAFTRDEITFLQLIIFHTVGFYFVYLINFILDFLYASAGYCI